MKSPFGPPSISFAGPKIRFLHITSPRKQLEGCRLEKEGPFSAGDPGRSTGSVSSMPLPYELTNAHFKVGLLLSYYGDTSVYSSNWLEGALLWDTLLEHTVQGILVKTMPSHCGQLPDYLTTG